MGDGLISGTCGACGKRFPPTASHEAMEWQVEMHARTCKAFLMSKPESALFVATDEAVKAEYDRRGFFKPLSHRMDSLTDEQLRDECKRRGFDAIPHSVRLNAESKLLRELEAVLGQEAGRHGISEGAVDVARRLIQERDEERKLSNRFGGYLDEYERFAREAGKPDGEATVLFIKRALKAYGNPVMMVPANLPLKWPGMDHEVVLASVPIKPRASSRRALESGPGLAASMPESKPIDPSSWPDELDLIADDWSPKR